MGLEATQTAPYANLRVGKKANYWLLLPPFQFATHGKIMARSTLRDQADAHADDFSKLNLLVCFSQLCYYGTRGMRISK